MWEAEAEDRLKEEQQRMAKQLHDMDTELQCLRESQNQGTLGSGTQENLFQCIIPGTQSTNRGEQKTELVARRIMSLSDTEKMTADEVVEDSDTDLSNLSAFIRSLSEVELPSVSLTTSSDALPVPAAVQDQSPPVANTVNPANAKRKYETIAPAGGEVKGDRAPASGSSRPGNEPKSYLGQFPSVVDCPEQQRSQQPSSPQPNPESQVKGPTARRQLIERSTEIVEVSERPSKISRTAKLGPTPLDKQTDQNYQTSEKLTTVPPHVSREKQTKAASIRKSKRIKQMDIMRAKFEDGPSRQRMA
jgi:hypothetical protein